METKQLIQASANVVRITNLKKGDVYKRFDDSSYSDKVRFGVVVGLYNDGHKTFIEAIEYKVGFGDIDADRQVFSGDKDFSIFPATFDDVKEHFASALTSIEHRIEDKSEELAKLRLTLQRGREFVTGELSEKLTEPEHRVMTQREYLEEQHEREASALE